jgi:hypothetical protein
MPQKEPVAAFMGSKMHLLPPHRDRADQRSVTPMGFATRVFEANKTGLPETGLQQKPGTRS